MTLDEVYKYFGSGNQVCKELGLSRNAFYVWTKRGHIPLVQQLRIEKITGGRLVASELKPQKEPGTTLAHIPDYRYWSSLHGMCRVDSLTFKEDMPVKIIYRTNSDPVRRVTAFDTQLLMQAIDLKDIEGKYLFEGDVIVGNNNKNYRFVNLSGLPYVLALDGFFIIGHIYDGKDYGAD